MVLVEGTPQPSPSRTTSAVLPTQPMSEAGSSAMPQQEGRASNAQQQGQNRGPRPSALGRFFSKMSVSGDSVAPEVRYPRSTLSHHACCSGLLLLLF